MLTRVTDPLDELYPGWRHLVAIARLDRPIGILLLLWPTLWALTIAAEGWPGWHLALVFVLGTVLTRSAGCIINDFADRELDGHVERTQGRPLATGELPVFDAMAFMGVLLFLALVLVLSTNFLTVVLAAVGALVAAIYPFMKRYTYMPQVVLGVAFSTGILMAFTAVTGSIPNEAWLLFSANLLWTVAYDTEYAMVDRDDDLKIGIRSTAILFGDLDRVAIGTLQVLFLGIILLAARDLELSFWFAPGFLAAAGLLGYQQYLIRDRAKPGCFAAFLNNHWVGFALFMGLVMHYIIA